MPRHSVWLVAVVAVVGCERPPERQPRSVKVLAFHGDSCPACRRNRPHLKTLQDRGVEIVHVPVENRPRMAEKYGVKQLPTYVVLKDGRVVRKTGDIWLLIQILRWLLPWLFGSLY